MIKPCSQCLQPKGKHRKTKRGLKCRIRGEFYFREAKKERYLKHDIKLTSYLEHRIFGYESDTFSAKGWQITNQEARRIANRLVRHFANTQLDGILISTELADMRSR